MQVMLLSKKANNRFLLDLIVFMTLLFFVESLSAQDYELTLNQRRSFDQIHVEIWARSINQNTAKFGFASLTIEYNTNYLLPSINQAPSITDSVNRNIDLVNPIDIINSDFNNSNGYNSLGYQNYGTGYYSLEINLASLGNGGLIPDSIGRGSFLGRLIFNIINSPSDTVNTDIAWSKSTSIGEKIVFDADSNNITSNIQFTDSYDFKIVGITILNPNFSAQVVDRDNNYLALNEKYLNGGYPIYFERSINPDDYLAPVGFPPLADDDLGYVFDYSLDNGISWSEFGRLVETSQEATQVGSNPRYRNGEIYNPNVFDAFTITTQSGNRITDTNYRKPLRVIWAKDNFFTDRSEQAKLKISFLQGRNIDNLSSRAVSEINDESDDIFVLGRLFFLQLNGTSQYLKTEKSFSNSTQLTVAAWVNLNSIQADCSEPAIVASSLGPDATQINGSTEGAWMLYLKDGHYPAFRVREIQNRGDAGYLASLSDVTSLTAVQSDSPLSNEHAKNWMHLAATVNNNEVTLYVNGEIVERSVNLNATDIRMLTTNHPIWVGVNPNTSIDAEDYLFAGIKEVQIWRTALTQDQIRQRVAGIVNPSDVSDYGDLRRGLDYYYKLEGSLDDKADDEIMQADAQAIALYDNQILTNQSLYYRPDQPHIRLTAPVGKVGVLNKENSVFEIRWVSYGLGDIEYLNSEDIEIEYSLDEGNSWYFVKDEDGKELEGANAPDIEISKIYWEAWENNNFGADLRTIFPFAHNTLLRIRGTASRAQEKLMDVSEPFTVARYFAMHNTEKSVIALAGSKGMNIIGSSIFLEAWIRPYRFPTEVEEYFPIISKYDSVNNIGHYSLRLLPTGQIEFTITDNLGIERIAISDINYPLVRPNSIAIDTSWTHIGVYIFLNEGSGASEIRFYIDGIVQRSDNISSQLGQDLLVNNLNKYPTFIAYHPGTGGGESKGFVGEMRELRFWNGSPNNTSTIGNEPSEMTLFVQGALAIRADELSLSYYENLAMSFSMNGTSFIYNGYMRAIGSETNPNTILRYHGEPISYRAVKPYIKLVEPEFRQKVANTRDDVRVRWVGFDYDGTGFTEGEIGGVPPSFEFSIRGGGGNIIQPYQFLGSKYWDFRQESSISFLDSTDFRFLGTGEDVFFASQVDFSQADPDIDNDGIFTDQGPMAASLTNARLRITGIYTVNNETDTIRSEGPLFSVTPATNFTIRLLLEGYHNGRAFKSNITNLASTYDGGGLRIKLYTDNAGALGVLIDSAESSEGYDEIDPINLNSRNNKFANIHFVFTDLTDGNYWVVVEQMNHLPIMSRFAAPFMYEGDDRSTWEIESGWDFMSWDGVDENIILNANTKPWEDNLFTAYGDAYSTSTNPKYSTTGLIFNNGKAGGTKDAIASMVGGDVNQDGKINAADRVRVRLDDGTGIVRSDVTGDGVINADDRTIVDRNYGKVSSLYKVQFPELIDEVPISKAQEYFTNDKPISQNNITNAKSNLLVNDKQNKLLSNGILYEVKAKPHINSNYIDLPMYIKNLGNDFSLANATFAVSYNSNVLSFDGLFGADSVIFSNDSSRGYAILRTAPRPDAENPLPEVRTIEVDYDAQERLSGINVPRQQTYLGTLKFNIKNQKSVIRFDWHRSTSVHATDSMVVTDDGIFIEIGAFLLYSADVLSPNGGEKLGANRNIDITWDTDGEALVFVEYTSNAGINWTRVNEEAISVNTKKIEWTTPDYYSSSYLIRLIDAETDVEIDRSNEKFSILPNFASISKPSSFDPLYHGGKSDSILWNTQGYESVKFEFSPDDGDNWEGISSTVIASNEKHNWKIPAITTKKALIRMIDIETDKEIARSGLFKILNGELLFKTPKNKEVLTSGKETRISWNSSNIGYFDLYLSIDGGSSWSLLQNDVLALHWYLNWTVPDNKATESAVLRALWDNDSEMEFDRTDRFTIRSHVSSVDELPAGYEFYNLSPNPTDGISELKFILPKSQNIQIKILDINGKFVFNIKDKYYMAGENIILLDLNSLSQGKYMVSIQGDNFIITKKITVIR